MKRIRTFEDAARWIDSAGYALLFHDSKSGLPSLWEAMGRKPVTEPYWDEDVARLWEWKDQLPRRRKAWYGKFFRAKGTLIAPRLLPYFSVAVGTPWVFDAAEILYSRGALSSDAHRVASALLEQGPQPTLSLRHGCGFSDRKGNARFKKAMAELQGRLLVTHFGAQKEEGAAWPSSVFELTPRAFSRFAKKAKGLSVEEARGKIEATRPLPGSFTRMIR